MLWGLFCALPDISSIPGLHPLDASNNPHQPDETTENVASGWGGVLYWHMSQVGCGGGGWELCLEILKVTIPETL